MTTKILSRWGAWLVILAIAIFTLSPIDLRPTIGDRGSPKGLKRVEEVEEFDLSDNLERFTAYAILGVLISFGYPKQRFAAVLLVIGMAGLLELAQSLTPDRDARFSDAIVKAFGSLIGAVVVMCIERHREVP